MPFRGIYSEHISEPVLDYFHKYLYFYLSKQCVPPLAEVQEHQNCAQV